MFDYLLRTWVINLKEFTVDKINHFVGEMAIEFQIAPTDKGELKPDKSFLYFNEKKKINSKDTLNLTVNIEYQTLLALTINLSTATMMPTFIFI